MSTPNADRPAESGSDGTVSYGRPIRRRVSAVRSAARLNVSSEQFGATLAQLDDLDSARARSEALSRDVYVGHSTSS